MIDEPEIAGAPHPHARCPPPRREKINAANAAAYHRGHITATRAANAKYLHF
jgi:hypothetical protein